MKVLLIKTSSMGDVIHTLPAITDAAQAIPNLQLDWVVEEGFSEIPSWHPSVKNVIPVALRRWRSNPIKSLQSKEWHKFRQQLKLEKYDIIIDAQGLIKSAFLARLGASRKNNPSQKISGFDWSSAREALASLAYTDKYYISTEQHAVERIRQLFAQALDYKLPSDVGYGGLDKKLFSTEDKKTNSPTVIFLHGTTRDDKHWPDEYWCNLCRQVTEAGWHVKIPWYNATEKERAEKIAVVSPQAEVLPKSNLKELATALANSDAFVAVDTGLGHLGAALDVPGISLYGSTDPKRIGAYGSKQEHLCAESMEKINVSSVEKYLKHL